MECIESKDDVEDTNVPNHPVHALATSSSASGRVEQVVRPLKIYRKFDKDARDFLKSKQSKISTRKKYNIFFRETDVDISTMYTNSLRSRGDFPFQLRVTTDDSTNYDLIAFVTKDIGAKLDNLRQSFQNSGINFIAHKDVQASVSLFSKPCSCF